MSRSVDKCAHFEIHLAQCVRAKVGLLWWLNRQPFELI
jgi:hypothetical protein